MGFSFGVTTSLSLPGDAWQVPKKLPYNTKKLVLRALRRGPDHTFAALQTTLR
jgi:hypothetical protein